MEIIKAKYISRVVYMPRENLRMPLFPTSGWPEAVCKQGVMAKAELPTVSQSFKDLSPNTHTHMHMCTHSFSAKTENFVC